MSGYINMDHAGWVERNIAASKRHLTKGDLRKAREEHRGWAAAPDTLNDFQRRAFTILGIVGGGIYNAPIAWKTFYWQPRVLICAWHKGFGTFDFSDLTRFVFLCHEARIRGHIGPLSHGHLEVCLSERRASGPVQDRHPNLDEAIAEWRASFPADHSIIYRAKAEGEAA
jgi:hypothetical protein